MQLLDPGQLAARVRRDAERNVLRVRNGLKHLAGVGQPRLGVTPHETVWSSGKIEVWRYRSDCRTLRTPLLLVHSLVSRSYVFDLVPGNSAVEFLRDAGFDVYLIDWGVPDELEAGNTLDTYSDTYLPAIIDRVADIAESPDVNVYAYCFGAVLALLGIAGNSELPVRSFTVQATPVDFSHMGTMNNLVGTGRMSVEDLLDHTGNVPADAMLNSFRMLQPTADVTTYVNLWEHLWNDEYVAAHEVMTQWGKDHIPFPGAAFVQTAELFGEQNLLASGRIPLNGRTIDLADITAPMLSVIGEKDHIVPPAASAPLGGLVGSAEFEELRLPAGHVGLMVGRTAQKRYLPAVADWLRRHSAELDG